VLEQDDVAGLTDKPESEWPLASLLFGEWVERFTGAEPVLSFGDIMARDCGRREYRPLPIARE
jgi:hypothetical protein